MKSSDQSRPLPVAAHTPTPRTNTAIFNGYDYLTKEARLMERQLSVMMDALEVIAKYDEHSPHGKGSCPYGCDTPSIARAALQLAKEGQQ